MPATGSYDKAFLDLRHELKLHLPPSLIYPNLRRVTSGAPRVGAFEVSVRPFAKAESVVVYSKLSKKYFPKAGEVIEELSCLLMPERSYFSERVPIVDVLVFDAYYKKPVPGARVVITRVATVVTNPNEPLEDLEALRGGGGPGIGLSLGEPAGVEEQGSHFPVASGGNDDAQAQGQGQGQGAAEEAEAEIGFTAAELSGLHWAAEIEKVFKCFMVQNETKCGTFLPHLS